MGRSWEPGANAETDKVCLKPWEWKNITIPLIVIGIGLSMIPWGSSIFRFCYHLLRELPLSSFFATMVQFSSITVLVGIACLIYILDKPRVVYLPYFVFALLLAGTVNSVIKESAGRSRPEWSVAMSKDKREELTEFGEAHPKLEIPLAKVDHWFGLEWNRPFFMDRYASFPSGHATAAFVVAAFLSLLYPKARKLWMIGAIACALARVRGERHYLEDVTVAAGLAWIIAHWVFSWEWPMRLGGYLARASRPRSCRKSAEVYFQAESTK